MTKADQKALLIAATVVLTGFTSAVLCFTATMKNIPDELFSASRVSLLVVTSVFMTYSYSIYNGYRWGIWLVIPWMVIQSLFQLTVGIIIYRYFEIVAWNSYISFEWNWQMVAVFAASVLSIASAFVAFFSEPLESAYKRRVLSETETGKWQGIITAILNRLPDDNNRKKIHLKSKDTEELISASLRRYRSGIVILALLAFSLILVSVSLIVIIIVIKYKIPVWQEDLIDFLSLVSGVGGPIDTLLLAATFAMVSLWIIILVLILYFLYFAFPSILCLPFALPLVLKWKRPILFLVLRPFNRRYLTGPLVNVIKREISGFGHTYTLSDATLHVPWYIRVPFFLGQISLFSHRLRIINQPKHLYHVCSKLRHTYRRNLNWFFSWNKVFPVACSDAGWKAVVSQMIYEVDFILIDVTGLSDNIIWELEQCRNLGKEDRVLLICEESEYKKLQDSLVSSLLNVYKSNHLFIYGGRERKEEQTLIAEIAKKLGAIGEIAG